nr:MIP/aquaporin family protein [Methanobacterium formicicum]
MSFFGTGAAIITLMISQGQTPPNSFNIGIGALGGLGDWLAIGLAFGLAISACIYGFGKVSGCHINPAVTIALWSVKKFPSRDVVPYVVAQLIGAALASLALAYIIGMGAVTTGGLGATAPFEGIGYLQAIVAEAIGTFILMLAIMGVAVDRDAPPGFAGLIIGLTVAGAITTLGNITGASLNCPDLWTLPGRSTSGRFQSVGLLPYIHHRAIVGAVLAAFVYNYLSETPQTG